MTQTKLTEGPVGPTLVRLTLPMVAGLIAIFLFNIVDTWFIGQLGPDPLAAMAFTFPVIFVVQSITMGIGIGTSAVVAQAIGEDHPEKVRRLTTHALLFAVALVTLIGVIGLVTIEPLFAALGAEPEMLPLIEQYMRPIYLGIGFLVVPMVGNSAIRATGDTKTPSIIMMVAGGVNLILDPIFIFGWGPVPRMELFGGALATVISWVVTFGAAFWLLAKREKMLALELPRPAAVWMSWKAILYVGLPAAGTNLLVPVAGGILTRLVSGHGPEAVAGFGVGGRIESMALVAFFALATGMAPFIGQNFGARDCGRIREGLRLAIRFSLVWGVVMAVVLALVGPTVAGLFSDDAAVIAAASSYLWLVPIGYAGYGVGIMVNTTLNATNRPLNSSLLIMIRLFVLTLPLAFLGNHLFGLDGLFGGAAVGYLMAGVVSYAFVARFLNRVESEMGTGPTPAPTPAT